MLVQSTNDCPTDYFSCPPGTQLVTWDQNGAIQCGELGDTIPLAGCAVTLPVSRKTAIPCLESYSCDPCGCAGSAGSTGGAGEDDVSPAEMAAIMAADDECVAALTAALADKGGA